MSLIADAPKEAPVSMMQPERFKPADDACERAMKDIEGFKQQITALKREEEQLGGHLLPESTNALSFATLRILVHLFSTKNWGHRDVGVMARKLNMERHALLYHLDGLHARGLAESGRENHRLGHIYWALTPRGCQYVVDHKLA
jgi:DNA-binding MarR family transcriptional regulator